MVSYTHGRYFYMFRLLLPHTYQSYKFKIDFSTCSLTSTSAALILLSQHLYHHNSSPETSPLTRNTARSSSLYRPMAISSTKPFGRWYGPARDQVDLDNFLNKFRPLLVKDLLKPSTYDLAKAVTGGMPSSAAGEAVSYYSCFCRCHHVE